MKDDYLKARLLNIEQRLHHLEEFTGLAKELRKLQLRRLVR
jgi:hypothetical protein